MKSFSEQSRDVNSQPELPLIAYGEKQTLGKNQLRFWRTVAISVGIQGPVAGVIVGPAILASLVGGPGSLAYVLGALAMGFVAYAFVIFAKKFNSASSIYAFNGSILGSRYGFVSAWLLLLVYVSFAGGVYASTADIAQNLFASWGIHLWWMWFALAGFVLTMFFAYGSIKISTVVILACEGIAVLLIAIVGLSVLLKGGYHARGINFNSFKPDGVAFSVLGLGVVNAFSAFSGFEGAATMGEESRRTTKTIPIAIAGSLIASSLVYIVFTWIAYLGFKNPQSLSMSAAPIVDLARQNIGSYMAYVVNIAGVISAFGAQLACVNAANRLLFAMSRDLVGSGSRLEFVKKVHPKYESPTGALTIVGGASLVTLLAFSKESTAIRALTLIVQVGAYLIIFAYLMTVIAAAVSVLREKKVVPFIALIVGAATLGYVIYDTFYPFPPYPFNWVVLASGLLFLGGIIFSFIPTIKSKLDSSALLVATRLRSV